LIFRKSLGISGYYARRDHVHPVNVDDTALPADNAATAAPGTSNRYARADHVHVGQAAALETVAPVADGVATVGVSTKGAHGDHRHPLNVDATVPPADSGSGSAGSASTYPRRDHAHPLNVDATAPATLGTANAAGSASVYARRDHVHADRVPTSVPSPVNFAFADENGNANSAASWVAGGSAGVTISVVTRVRYTETDGTPAIYAYYRNLTFDVFGRLYSQSTEGWYVVDAPVTLSV